MTLKIRSAVMLISLLAIPLRAGSLSMDERWVAAGQSEGMFYGDMGYSGYVVCFAADGSGNVYAGGVFHTAGGIMCENIAKWDGKEWKNLGTGLEGWVRAVALDSAGNLFAAGDFNKPGSEPGNYVAQWVGTSWRYLGQSMLGASDQIRALAADRNGNLYAAGVFDSVASTGGTSKVAKWNGTAWSGLGRGITGDEVNALVVDAAGILYAAGSFKAAGDREAANIAKWNGSAWEPVGNGIDGRVSAMTFDRRGNLYVAGNFDGSKHFLAMWNGAAWIAIGGSCCCSSPEMPCVSSIAFDSHGNLLAAGRFQSIGSTDACNIALWDGAAWAGLGDGISETPFDNGPSFLNAIIFDAEGTLFAGGAFAKAGGKPASNVAEWRDDEWQPVAAEDGGGFNSSVYCLALDSAGCLYAGGTFTSIGPKPFHYIAKRNGDSWAGMEKGPNGYVSSIVCDGRGNLYACGAFDSAGATLVNGVAKWDGVSWSPMGKGINGYVNTLECDHNGNIFAAGRFDTAGGVAARNIAEWDGSRWRPLGKGVAGAIFDLAFDGPGNLYAAGEIQDCGEGGAADSFYGVAQWSGGAWSGSKAIKGTYTVVAADREGTVYAGEYYAGGIVRCGEDAWTVATPGLGRAVIALAFDDSNRLLVGGKFDLLPDGKAVNYMARWKNGAWEGLGSGLKTVSGSGGVSTMAFDKSGNLNVGGFFSTAGGKVSTNFATFRSEAPVSARPHGKGAAFPRISYDPKKCLLRISGTSTTTPHIRLYSPTGRELSAVWERMANVDHAFRLRTEEVARGVYIAEVKSGAESLRCRIMKN